MNRGTIVAAAAITIIVAAAAVALFTLQEGGGEKAKGHGLTIVVSFPNLADDVKLLACRDDIVYSLAPPGSDPHSYQLTVNDYKLLKRASIVITTGHAPFEIEIARSVSRDKLIVIPDLLREKGGIILVNPDTGQPNLHMPIYDPRNYITFINALAEKLAEKRSGCRSHYLAAAENVTRFVEDLMRRGPHLNVTAVGSAPPVQYAVSWLGVRIEKLLVREHGVSPTPADIQAITSLLSTGKARLVVIMVDGEGRPLTPADRKLEEVAEKYGVPVLKVPAPYLPGSIPSKLEYIVEEAESIAGK